METPEFQFYEAFQESSDDDQSGHLKHQLTCKICNASYENYNVHKNTKEHKKEKRNQGKKTKTEQKQQRKLKKVERRNQKQQNIVADNSTAKQEISFTKETYFKRQDQKLGEPTQRYQNALATFLVVRLALNNQEFQLSLNNNIWKQFGDVVFELPTQNGKKIYAIQCKGIQNRKEISISTLGAESGKFSIKEQCEILQRLSTGLRKKEIYDQTHFILFTVCGTTEAEFIYDVENWQNGENKEVWKGRQTRIELSKKKSLINTTDSNDENIFVFKILNSNNEKLNSDLSKFSLFTNQQKTESLRTQIQMMIEDKFDYKRAISGNLIKFVCEYFKTEPVNKLTKRDLLLKIAELMLEPFMVFPEVITGQKSVEKWSDIINKFDIIVIRDHSDITSKIYNHINSILRKRNSSDVDISVSSIAVYKDSWRNGTIPLVLTAESEINFLLVTKIISFLKSESIPRKFIIGTNLELKYTTIPENLRAFTILDDLRKVDQDYWKKNIENLEIPVLDFSVIFKDLVDLNEDLLLRVTPDTLLNIFLQDFSFKNVSVPMSDDIMANTFVVNDDIIEKLKTKLKEEDDTRKNNFLSYTISVNGCPSRVEVPPDI